MGPCSKHDVRAFDRELPVEPVAHHAVGHALAALDRIELKVGFHEVPIALIAHSLTWHEIGARREELLLIRVAAAEDVTAGGITVCVPVAARRRPTLHDVGEVLACPALIDVRPIL